MNPDAQHISAIMPSAGEIGILGMGTVVVDHILTLDRPLSGGLKHEVADERIQIGGPVPTALALVSRWGIQCGFSGFWGHDHHGRLIEAHLKTHNIAITSQTAGLSESSRSGFAHVWIEPQSGTRTICAYRGSGKPSIPGNFPGRFTQARMVYLDGWPPDVAVEMAAMARGNGLLVFADLGSPKDRLDEFLPLVTHLNCPIDFIRRAWGLNCPDDGADRLLKAGIREVTITDGSRGAWFYSPDEKFHFPARPISPLDTNGAGDCFAGAMAFGLFSGWDARKKVAFATEVAALKCLQAGNSPVLPPLGEILKVISMNTASAG